MELRHLRYFMAVAETGSFVQAAQRLHISQPPLSTQIQALERELGVRLFERTNRGATLTAAGSAFHAEAGAVLARLAQACAAARSVGRGEQGSVDVGFVSTADTSLLPPALKRFRALYPGVEVQLHELTTDAQLRELQAERLDIGLALWPVDDPGMRFVPLIQEPLILALPGDHIAARDGQPVSLASLAGERFVMVPRPLAPGLHDMTIAFCQSLGFVPQVRQFARQMQTVISLVSSDFGVALVPASLQHLQRTGVCYRPVREAGPSVQLGALHPRHGRNPAVPHFIDTLLAAAAAWQAQPAPG